MIKRAICIAAVGASALGHAPAAAEAPQAYIPPVAKFNGTNGINLPADLTLDMQSVGTIEFWAAATWTDEPELDPAVLADNGPDGPRYSVHIAKDRQAIGFYTAAGGASLPFDFSDGKLHHVALVSYDGGTEIYVDGEEIGIIEIGYADVPAQGFHIGSFNGVDAPFTGGIASLRVWDTMVDIEDLAAYSTKDILSAEGRTHPDFESLVGVSHFEDGHRGFYLLGLSAEDQIQPEIPVDLPEDVDPDAEPEPLPDLFGALDGYDPPASLPDDY